MYGRQKTLMSSKKNIQNGNFDGLDGKRVVKNANLYFANHPTCLKRDSADMSENSSDAERRA